MAISFKTFKYTVEDNKDDFILFDSAWDTWHPSRLAEDAAIHFDKIVKTTTYWPLFFIIYTESGNKIGEFIINREMRLYFLTERLDE